MGLWAAVGLLFLSATGLTWSKYAGDHVDELRAALSWNTPKVDATLPASTGVPPGGVAQTAERVWAAARAHGLSDPVKIVPAGEPGEAWVVQQVQRSWPSKQDSVAVDPATGTVVNELHFADWPLMAKLARWGIDAHMGLLFGLASPIALAALALGMIVMIVWGYRMWWLRRPTRGIPGPLGNGHGRSFSALVVLGVLGVAIGVFLPLLGAALLLFLVIDALRAQRTGAAVAGSDPGNSGT